MPPPPGTTTAVVAAAAATTATAADQRPAENLAKAPGLAVSQAGRIFVNGKLVANGTQPQWSPEGRRIVYERIGEIFVIDADGKNKTRLTKHVPSLHWPGRSPTWSPAGKTIAFTGVFDVLTVDIATKRITNLTKSQHSWRGNYTPAYSPDGRTIAFSRNTNAFNADIFLMSSHGRNLRRLTKSQGSHDTLGEETMPTWSPRRDDARHASNRDGNIELYAIGRNGVNERRLTTTPGYNEWRPRFSRDGKRILYTHSGRVAHMKSDGTDVRELGLGNEADWR